MTTTLKAKKHYIQLPKDTNIIAVPNILLKMQDERDSYDNGTVSNGYGQASGVYVTVQKGTSAKIDIDFTITTISVETFNQWKSQVSQYFNQQQSDYLEENYGSVGFMGGFFAGAFGALFGGGDYNHYKNSSSSFHTDSHEQQEGFAKSVYNLNTSNFHVTGTLTAEGTSFIPATVSAYVQVTKIKFADNKELHVISTDSPVAADRNGSSKGAKSESTQLTLTSL
ncbi:hypothetical protein [Nostoc sp. CCY 9925]|uniref:hypothetical protein n=1 Tax=Nostoc sp. CCY 9925 TaxID=3103865 RepID=UPI0039C68241